MKIRPLLAVLALLSGASDACFARGGGGGHVSVSGHFRSGGTYVQPHMRSAPDHTPLNNWSVKPNVNPYTGAPGTHNPPLDLGTFRGR